MMTNNLGATALSPQTATAGKELPELEQLSTQLHDIEESLLTRRAQLPQVFTRLFGEESPQPGTSDKPERVAFSNGALPHLRAQVTAIRSLIQQIFDDHEKLSRLI